MYKEFEADKQRELEEEAADKRAREQRMKQRQEMQDFRVKKLI